MNESRLREIDVLLIRERKNVELNASVFIHELADALRKAWRERDKARAEVEWIKEAIERLVGESE